MKNAFLIMKFFLVLLTLKSSCSVVVTDLEVKDAFVMVSVRTYVFSGC